jgi:hypothetical protein
MSSSKISKDTFEPLKLDTTLLKIDVKTEGDLTTKEYDLIPFHPNMADMKDLSNNNYILFPSFIKITMNDLKKSGAVGTGQDYKKIFTNLEKFINLIKYVTRSNKSEEDYTLLVDQTQFKNYALSFVQDFTSDITFDFRAIQKYEPLTENEIITNNIGVIKSLFFPVGAHFFILGHDYVINKSKYIPPYSASDSVNQALKDKKQIPLTYEINIELQLVDATNNPNIGEFSRLSCKAKKNSIKNDFHELFDTKLGIYQTPKAVLPSLTVPTTTSKRGFGKLQVEWEERNKYIKQALTEKERLEQESKKTALQKKMDKFEKKQEYYKKIPSGWITETKELNDKYKTFDESIISYVNKYNELTQKDFSTKEVEENVINAVKQLAASIPIDDNFIYSTEPSLKTKQKEYVEKIIKEIDDENINNLLKDPNFTTRVTRVKTLARDLKTQEEGLLGIKYVEPFLKDMIQRQKDVTALTEERKIIKERIAEDKIKNNNYNVQANQQELVKVENRLIKATADYELLKTKLGEYGEKLITTWNSTITEMENFKKAVKQEKTSSENRILNDSVNAELKKKMEEITKLKKTLYLAYFKEGLTKEVTKSEKDRFEKEPAPIETVSELETNLKMLEEDYLEIAAKISVLNKIQGIVTLLTADMNRVKELKKAKDDEKNTIDKKLKDISTEIANLTKNLSETDLNLMNSDDKSQQEEFAKKYPRIQSLNADQIKNQNLLKPRVELLTTYTTYETQYKSKISEIQTALRNKTANYNIFSYDNTIKQLREGFKTKLSTNLGDEEMSGGDSTATIKHYQNHTHELKHKNSKRRLLKLKKIIKTLNRHYKKKKSSYTRRHHPRDSN